MPALLASITDPIVNFAVDVVDALGLLGVFVLMTLESACIPVPSEATMLFAGFNVSDGEYSLFAAVAVGSVANLVGSWIAYAIGYYGRIDILEKHGKKLHIKKSHLEWADRWFERHGDATVFFTRMLPIIRTFISLPAGVARMPFWRFSVLTLLGCVPWVLMLTFIGKEAGDNWEQWKDSLHYVDYAVAAAIVIGVAYLVIRRWRRPPPDAAAESRLSARHAGAFAPAARIGPMLDRPPHELQHATPSAAGARSRPPGCGPLQHRAPRRRGRAPAPSPAHRRWRVRDRRRGPAARAPGGVVVRLAGAGRDHDPGAGPALRARLSPGSPRRRSSAGGRCSCPASRTGRRRRRCAGCWTAAATRGRRRAVDRARARVA